VEIKNVGFQLYPGSRRIQRLDERGKESRPPWSNCNAPDLWSGNMAGGFFLGGRVGVKVSSHLNRPAGVCQSSETPSHKVLRLRPACSASSHEFRQEKHRLGIRGRKAQIGGRMVRQPLPGGVLGLG
jgi:hypothetical protein